MQGDMEASQVPARRRGRIATALRTGFARVLDIALPQLCAACREPVHGAGLCAECWSKLSFIAPPYCERLGIPFPFEMANAGRELLADADAIVPVPLHWRRQWMRRF